ncbi:S8 family serine peptidase [Kitasatospora cheerisanensis]|uniref:S8 family serine peptidase n=1 Tax=Kitasatospora cheerisanensis TaxID=81942 RepID=UPI000A42E942|nr:S8 family serine peptidase [Kitasatospora cheerisanensis]
MSWPLDGRHFDAERLWQHSTGRGVVVAVVDSGVDASRPDLARQVMPGTSLLGDGGDGRSDASGDAHGTAIAAIIAASAPAGSPPGAVGLAPGASILPVRVMADTAADPRVLAQGMTWAVDHGARVINVSIAADQPNQLVRQAVEYADRHGVIVVAAAGNQGETGNPPQYPAAFPGVVSVSGIDESGAFWTPSESGAVAVAAPAHHVVSADNHGSLQTISGTSYAAAYVSATAALLMEKYPQLGAHQIVRRILDTTSAHHDRPDARTGYGLLDPRAALESSTPLPTDTSDPLRAAASPTARPQGSAMGPAAVLTALVLAVLASAAAVIRRRRARTRCFSPAVTPLKGAAPARRGTPRRAAPRQTTSARAPRTGNRRSP